MTPLTPGPARTVFVAQLPHPPPTPVVVSVPHAGVSTEGFEAALTSGLDVRCDADLWVDELYQAAQPTAFIHATLSRFVCDLNRDPDDVSLRAVRGHPDPRNVGGRGFIWEVTTGGQPTLTRALSPAEWENRRQIHAAYHRAISDALARARARFGWALLVDGHSMPSVGRSGHADSGRERAAVVPGDRLGKSCDPRISALVGQHFSERGLSVAFNDPYGGGFTTAHHGTPDSGIHAIQIEVRRDLYMDETTYARKPAEMATVSRHLDGLLRKLESLTL